MGLPKLVFDHVLYGVENLEAARDTARKLGFVVTPRGRHTGWPTANYCIMLRHDYIELLGMVAAADDSHSLTQFLATGGDGLMGLAFGTTDAEQLMADLRERDLEPHGPFALSRLLELPEGDVTPRFSLVRLPPEQIPGFYGFFAQHHTPELLRRPEWEMHPNAATGIHSMTVAVENPAEIAARWEKIVGRANVVPTDDSWAVHVGRQVVLFVSPDEAAGLYPDGGAGRAAPAVCGLTLTSASLEQTRAALKAGGASFESLPGGVVRVYREDAFGAVLDFIRE
jgi:hypothetical protein